MAPFTSKWTSSNQGWSISTQNAKSAIRQAGPETHYERGKTMTDKTKNTDADVIDAYCARCGKPIYFGEPQTTVGTVTRRAAHPRCVLP